MVGGGALLPSGLVVLARGSGDIGVICRFVVALVMGLGLRDDSSLEELSTDTLLFFWLELFHLGLGLGFDMVPTDDSSLEDSSAGACIITPPVAMALMATMASFDHVVVAVASGGDHFVVGATKFVAAARANKEGNAGVGLVVVKPKYHAVVPGGKVMAMDPMATVVFTGGSRRRRRCSRGC
jgi:hypothetical protein